MRPFEPTYGIWETTKNIMVFIYDNLDVLWNIMAKLAPFIIALFAFDIGLKYFVLGKDMTSGEYKDIGIGGFITNYFYLALAISWHRVIIQGPDKFEFMNPLKPQEKDWAFMGMGILISFSIGLVIVLISLIALPILTVLFGHEVLLIGVFLIAALCIGIWISTKFVFYFPAKATGSNLTLLESYKMTNGYTYRLIASWVILICTGYLFIVIYALIIYGAYSGLKYIVADLMSMPLVLALLELFFNLPFSLFLEPLISVIVVTAISNYYQHALQNKGIPE